MKRTSLFKLLPAFAVASTLVISSAIPVYADDSSTDRPSLLQRIMQRFGLSQEDIDQTVEEHRQEMQTYRRTQMENRLNQAVTDGKISDTQKSLILKKMSEWQETHENWYDLSREERRTKMEEHREDMENWANENGIDLDVLRGYGGGMNMKGFRDGAHRGRNF